MLVAYFYCGLLDSSRFCTRRHIPRAAERLLSVVSNFRRLRSVPRGIESRIYFNFSAVHNVASQSSRRKTSCQEKERFDFNYQDGWFTRIFTGRAARRLGQSLRKHNGLKAWKKESGIWEGNIFGGKNLTLLCTLALLCIGLGPTALMVFHTGCYLSSLFACRFENTNACGISILEITRTGI